MKITFRILGKCGGRDTLAIFNNITREQAREIFSRYYSRVRGYSYTQLYENDGQCEVLLDDTMPSLD